MVGIVEIKGSDWERMTERAVRRNAKRYARQVWDYIQSQLAEEKEVCPGVIFPRRPQSGTRLRLVESLFNEEGIQVVWNDESIEECKARNSGEIDQEPRS